MYSKLGSGQSRHLWRANTKFAGRDSIRPGPPSRSLSATGPRLPARDLRPDPPRPPATARDRPRPRVRMEVIDPESSGLTNEVSGRLSFFTRDDHRPKDDSCASALPTPNKVRALRPHARALGPRRPPSLTYDNARPAPVCAPKRGVNAHFAYVGLPTATFLRVAYVGLPTAALRSAALGSGCRRAAGAAGAAGAPRSAPLPRPNWVCSCFC
jgi:hypothetical protein